MNRHIDATCLESRAAPPPRSETISIADAGFSVHQTRARRKCRRLDSGQLRESHRLPSQIAAAPSGMRAACSVNVMNCLCAGMHLLSG